MTSLRLTEYLYSWSFKLLSRAMSHKKTLILRLGCTTPPLQNLIHVDFKIISHVLSCFSDGKKINLEMGLRPLILELRRYTVNYKQRPAAASVGPMYIRVKCVIKITFPINQPAQEPRHCILTRYRLVHCVTPYPRVALCVFLLRLVLNGVLLLMLCWESADRTRQPRSV